MVNLTLKFYKRWNNHLSQVYPHHHHSITTWLVNTSADHCHQLSSEEMSQLITYRYQILAKRYVNTSQKQAYNRLIARLAAIILAYTPIQQKINQKKLSKKDIVHLTQQLVAKILHHDPNFQKNLNWIRQCTSDEDLKNALTLASLEEYAGRMIGEKPLILHHLRHLLTNYSFLAV